MNMKHFFRRKSSCQVAKDRLKILLISDRVNCSPEMMELIKADITKVISKYMNRYRPYGDRDTGKRRQQKREK